MYTSKQTARLKNSDPHSAKPVHKSTSQILQKSISSVPTRQRINITKIDRTFAQTTPSLKQSINTRRINPPRRSLSPTLIQSESLSVETATSQSSPSSSQPPSKLPPPAPLRRLSPPIPDLTKNHSTYIPTRPRARFQARLMGSRASKPTTEPPLIPHLTNQSSQITTSQPTQLTPEEVVKYPNYAFQLGQSTLKPDQTTTLPMILSNWRADYKLLERHHNYIQWLFPLFEVGVNRHQPPLTNAEVELIRNSPLCRAHQLQSFNMMLNFWGFECHNQQFNDPSSNSNSNSNSMSSSNINNPDSKLSTHLVTRHHDPNHVKMMFDNWMCTHNDLRVTRCMKSLYILNHKPQAFAFLKALYNECKPDGYPRAAGLRMALDQFWFPIFEDDPLFKQECGQMRQDMKSWPKSQRGLFSAF